MCFNNNRVQGKSRKVKDNYHSGCILRIYSADARFSFLLPPIVFGGCIGGGGG